MQAEIIAIGDEILIGQTVDTNSAWLGEQLNLIGIKVYQATSISDDRTHILESLRIAENRSDVVLITGGLGPTKDDITKKTLCEYFDTHLEMNKEVLALITAFFASRGKQMLEVNALQAEMPAAADTIINVRGTASGMWFERNGTIFISMPGVPYEMKGLMRDEILGRLSSRFQTDKIYHRTILTLGVGESFLAESNAGWEQSLEDEGIKLAYLPSAGRVKLRLSAFGEDYKTLQDKVDRKVAEFVGANPQIVYGYNKDTLELVVGQQLEKLGGTLALAESCSGGFISHLITSIPGSSSYYKGSVVAYAYETKWDVLGVDKDLIETEGAVSQRVAEQMADGVRKALKTDYAISTTGIAGPGGGTEDKPVGTVWMAWSGPIGTVSKRFLFGNSRSRNIQMTANAALHQFLIEINKGKV